MQISERAAKCLEHSNKSGSPELKAAWEGMAKYWVAHELAQSMSAARENQRRKAVDLDALIKQRFGK
jgi:hypothetical protein